MVLSSKVFLVPPPCFVPHGGIVLAGVQEFGSSVPAVGTGALQGIAQAITAQVITQAPLASAGSAGSMGVASSVHTPTPDQDKPRKCKVCKKLLPPNQFSPSRGAGRRKKTCKTCEERPSSGLGEPRAGTPGAATDAAKRVEPPAAEAEHAVHAVHAGLRPPCELVVAIFMVWWARMVYRITAGNLYCAQRGMNPILPKQAAPTRAADVPASSAGNESAAVLVRPYFLFCVHKVVGQL